jgi:hypothetical protein
MSGSILIYGDPKIGKTTDVAATFRNACWIETEPGGLTPVARALGYEPGHVIYVLGADRPLAEMKAALATAAGLAQSGEVNCVVIDTLSTWAERLIKSLTDSHKDGRQAYGALSSDVPGIVDELLELPCWKVVIAHMAPPEQDTAGVPLRGGPCLPGKKLTRSLPRKFDLVLRADIQDDLGDSRRAYSCDPTNRQWISGDRFGVTLPSQDMELRPLVYRIVTNNEEPPEEWQRKVLSIRSAQ